MLGSNYISSCYTLGTDSQMMFCEMSVGGSGEGVMHRGTVNPAVRWFIYVLLCIVKVEEMGRFQCRLAPCCSKLWTNTWGKKSHSQRSRGVNRKDSKRKREENQIP